MEVKKCPKGHYYDAGSLTECPVCAAENQMPKTVPLPPAGLKVCPNGHYYNPEIYDKCPECSIQMPKTVILDLDRLDTEAGFKENYMTFPENSETVLFVAYEDMRFRFWKEGQYHKAQLHWLKKPDAVCKPMVFEKEMDLSEDEFEAAINKVLQFVYGAQMEQRIPESGEKEPNARLMLDTWLIRKDYSWYDAFGEDGTMKYICRALKVAMARAEKARLSNPWALTAPIQPQNSLHMELRYEPPFPKGKYTLHATASPWNTGEIVEAELEESLEPELSLKLRKKVYIPGEQAAFLQQILETDFMQTVIKCMEPTPTVLPGGDPPTVKFYYHWSGLEFQYNGFYRAKCHEDEYAPAKVMGVLSKWMVKYEQEIVPIAPQNHWYTLP